jgi:hypothetical protein
MGVVGDFGNAPLFVIIKYPPIPKAEMLKSQNVLSDQRKLRLR